MTLIDGSLHHCYRRKQRSSCHCCNTLTGRHRLARLRIVQSFLAHSTCHCCNTQRGRIPNATTVVRAEQPAQVQSSQEQPTATPAPSRAAAWGPSRRSARNPSRNQPSSASVLLHTRSQKTQLSQTIHNILSIKIRIELESAHPFVGHPDLSDSVQGPEHLWRRARRQASGSQRC